MKSSIYIGLAAFVLSANSAFAQIKNSKLVTVKISGNCGMCKSTIEEAGNKNNESQVVWNNKTGEASVTYDTTKTTEDAVLHSIALAGYDNERYLAPAENYASLHSCCRYDRELKADEPITDAPSKEYTGHLHADTHAAHEAASTNVVGSLITPYLRIKDALIDADSKEATLAATAMTKAFATLQSAALNKDEKTAWATERKALEQSTAAIAAGKSIAQQRQAFDNLSRSFYKLLKGTDQSKKLYYQHCPMYQDGKGGFWLSSEQSIKNPYYGSQMLSCGKTVETL